MKQNPTQPEYIRINDAVNRYSLSRSTFNRAIAKGELKRIKKGRAVLLVPADIEQWLISDAA